MLCCGIVTWYINKFTSLIVLLRAGFYSRCFLSACSSSLSTSSSSSSFSSSCSSSSSSSSFSSSSPSSSSSSSFSSSSSSSSSSSYSSSRKPTFFAKRYAYVQTWQTNKFLEKSVLTLLSFLNWFCRLPCHYRWHFIGCHSNCGLRNCTCVLAWCLQRADLDFYCARDKHYFGQWNLNMD